MPLLLELTNYCTHNFHLCSVIWEPLYNVHVFFFPLKWHF
uniref:Uncharacterized protein n=1 Tax=Anguilla anguilla TaxID=7936 RepID=A0A0E9S0M3_ANGAN